MFLDRDGVIIEGGHVNHPDQVRLIPGAAEAMRVLRAAGFSLVIVTNQGGLGEGFDGRLVWRKAPLNRQSLEAIHQEMLRQLGPDAAPDAIKICPHATFLNCNCRKPKPGMLRSAARDLGLDLAASYLVGDRDTDLEAAVAAGARPVLVLTGDGQASQRQWGERASVVASIREAADSILAANRSATPDRGSHPA
ncbi:MAG: D-glycero-alpha-D-manno-heptose-1,7-bisphosphate 7-phosphatase [Chloroflexota bacterium]